MPCWYYEKEDLETTPSIKDGIDPGTEARYRREGSRFIIEAGTTQGLRYDTMATGVVYFHRFYMFHSFKEFPRYIMGAACLFLAGKVEETPKKCKDIIKIAKNILSEQHFAAFGDDPKEEIMTHERILLQTIKFDLQVEHPYSYLLKYAKTFKGDKDKIQKLVQMAWTFVNDSLCTTLCLQWEPNIVAVGFLYLAGRLSKSDLMDWSGKTTKIKWWEQLTEDVSLDIMEEICHKLLDLYAEGQQKGPPGSQGTPTKNPPKRPKPKSAPDGPHGDPKAKMSKQEHSRENSRPPPPPPPSGGSTASSHVSKTIATHERRQASPAPPPPPRGHSGAYPPNTSTHHQGSAPPPQQAPTQQAPSHQPTPHQPPPRQAPPPPHQIPSQPAPQHQAQPIAHHAPQTASHPGSMPVPAPVPAPVPPLIQPVPAQQHQPQAIHHQPPPQATQQAPAPQVPPPATESHSNPYQQVPVYTPSNPPASSYAAPQYSAPQYSAGSVPPATQTHPPPVQPPATVPAPAPTSGQPPSGQPPYQIPGQYMNRPPPPGMQQSYNRPPPARPPPASTQAQLYQHPPPPVQAGVPPHNLYRPLPASNLRQPGVPQTSPSIPPQFPPRQPPPGHPPPSQPPPSPAPPSHAPPSVPTQYQPPTAPIPAPATQYRPHTPPVSHPAQYNYPRPQSEAAPFPPAPSSTNPPGPPPPPSGMAPSYPPPTSNQPAPSQGPDKTMLTIAQEYAAKQLQNMGVPRDVAMQPVPGFTGQQGGQPPTGGRQQLPPPPPQQQQHPNYSTGLATVRITGREMMGRRASHGGGDGTGPTYR